MAGGAEEKEVHRREAMQGEAAEGVRPAYGGGDAVRVRETEREVGDARASGWAVAWLGVGPAQFGGGFF